MENKRKKRERRVTLFILRRRTSEINEEKT